jgi:hypothetical protein
MKIKNELQWKPLNVITLVQSQTDNINGMITIGKSTTSFISYFTKIDFGFGQFHYK